MRIKEVLTRWRNDFTALMECEHCGHTQKLLDGYADAFYCERVIPARHCESCGANSLGEVRQATSEVSATVAG